jgi:putative ABC transport system ATP-binding protein
VGDSGADLVVHGLRKTFRSPPVRALRGVDLTVRRGEFVALMGPSGCGKSTLLHLVAGLDEADEGSVSLAGVRTEELGAARLGRLRRRHVGLVFQFFHLIEHMSALENVAKHAPGARVELRLAAFDDVLRFSVSDDGPGFEPSATPGAGLQNMADRVGAIGGGVECRSAPGAGTAVIGTVPIPDEAERADAMPVSAFGVG